MNPYEGKSVDTWLSITQKLVDEHPLKPFVVEICLNSWKSMLEGKFNDRLNRRVKDMSLTPQATGALLHDLIPEYVEANEIKGFRKGRSNNEKDIVCIFNDGLSIEIKTSSQSKIYGNRSYAVSDTGKGKSGYYITINFERTDKKNPEILFIKMGWLDHTDWHGQKSQTGQQASISKDVWENKLITLHKLQIDINTADYERLQTLEGIGPTTAQKIIDHREANGKYESVDDLFDVKGVREKTVKYLQDAIII